MHYTRVLLYCGAAHVAVYKFPVCADAGLGMNVCICVEFIAGMFDCPYAFDLLQRFTQQNTQTPIPIAVMPHTTDIIIILEVAIPAELHDHVDITPNEQELISPGQ